LVALPFSLFVIPLNYRKWFSPLTIVRTRARKTLTGYIGIQIFSIVCLFGDVIYRSVVYQTPCSTYHPTFAECNNPEFSKIAWVFYSLDMASFIASIVGIVMAVFLRALFKPKRITPPAPATEMTTLKKRGN